MFVNYCSFAPQTAIYRSKENPSTLSAGGREREREREKREKVSKRRCPAAPPFVVVDSTMCGSHFGPRNRFHIVVCDVSAVSRGRAFVRIVCCVKMFCRRARGARGRSENGALTPPSFPPKDFYTSSAPKRKKKMLHTRHREVYEFRSNIHSHHAEATGIPPLLLRKQ